MLKENFKIEYRYAAGTLDRMPVVGVEQVKVGLVVIVPVPGIVSAKQAGQDSCAHG